MHTFCMRVTPLSQEEEEEGANGTKKTLHYLEKKGVKEVENKTLTGRRGTTCLEVSLDSS